MIARLEVDDVLLAFVPERFAEMRGLVTQLVSTPCSLWLVPDHFSLLFYGATVEDLGGLAMVSLKVPTLTDQQRLMKRAFDLVVASALLVVSAPLLVLISAAIRLTSSGVVVFRQQRVAENGRLFWMYKFRSMVEGALPPPLESHKPERDPRVTWVGRLLRRTSLDELPQLLNVLKGDMSLVGPRPELPALVERYEPWQRQRFAVPQGMTGWWQVRGRSTRPMHLHTEDDLYYVKHYSLFLDLQILLRTFVVVLRGRGAY